MPAKKTTPGRGAWRGTQVYSGLQVVGEVQTNIVILKSASQWTVPAWSRPGGMRILVNAVSQEDQPGPTTRSAMPMWRR